MAERVICTSMVAKNSKTSALTNIVSKKIGKFSTKLTLADIIDEVIGDREIPDGVNYALDHYQSENVDVQLSSTENGDPFTIDVGETLDTAFDFNKDLKYIKFIIKIPDINKNVAPSNMPEKNAFQIMFDSTKCNEQRAVQTDTHAPRFTEKDRLYNIVCEHLTSNSCYFPNTMSKDDVKKNVNIVTNILWYLDGNMEKITERADHNIVTPIPERFLQNEFSGFNDWRRKRKKALSLSSEILKSHSTSLFRLLSYKFTAGWGALREDLENLSLSMNSYATYLDDKNTEQQQRQKMNQPPRQIGDHTFIETKNAAETVSPKYSLLDSAIRKLDCYEYVYFNEERHVDTPFKSYSERYHFIDRMSLSVPVCIMSYCPGSQLSKVVYVWKIPDNKLSDETMKNVIAIYERLKASFPEFHTRQMRKDFISRYCRLNSSSVPKHVLRGIYSDLSLDCTAMQNPTVDTRVQQAVLSEDPDLVLDMRHMNQGRPNDTFNAFFEKLCSKVEEYAAVDDRRHENICHFSKYISVPDLIKDVAADLPEGTAIPSESSVLYSFVPKNSFAKSAKLYTSKVPLQFKVKTRQLRLSHIDEHYCSALFKYAREYAVKFKEDVTFLCVDDKCKVDFGEPGAAIQSGVRGKKAIVPVGANLSSLDHDQGSKGSLTPSVCLKVDLPDDTTGSFYRGEVCVAYKDSVFESSSPFRHATEIEHFLRRSEIKPVLIIYSDGGPDHRLTYHSVILSLIVLFKRLGVDTLIAIRTAPGHSWVNPAERIMSVLNIALQNCALTRSESSSDNEQILKSANSMSDIRKKAEKTPSLKQAWIESVAPIKELLGDRTRRLSLKGVPFIIQNAADGDDVEETEANVRMFVDGSIEKGKYQQQHLKSKEDYQKYLEDHCHQRHYSFQISKCNKPNCCGPRMREEPFPLLPDPVLRPDDKDHYKPFEDVVNTETREGRPSADVPKPREVAEQLQGVRNPGLIAQNVRWIVHCYECGKPRCVYSRKALSVRDARAFGRLLDKYDYCCGSMITPEGDALDGIVSVRLQLSCQSHVEFSYYASSRGRQDVCAHCGIAGAEKNKDLCNRYRVVLPVCTECLALKKDIPKRNPIK